MTEVTQDLLAKGADRIEEKPLYFSTLLENKEALVNETVELYCEMSRIGVDVTWLKDNKPLSMAEGKYQIINRDYSYSLLIPSVSTEDSGEYTVKVDDLRSTAILTVCGQFSLSTRSHSSLQQKIFFCRVPNFIC